MPAFDEESCGTRFKKSVMNECWEIPAGDRGSHRCMIEQTTKRQGTQVERHVPDTGGTTFFLPSNAQMLMKLNLNSTNNISLPKW